MLDIILRKKTKTSVSEETLRILLRDCLPFDAATGETTDNCTHTEGWTTCVQSDDDVAVAAVDRILTDFRHEVQLLAKCTDANGRRAVDIAGPRSKKLVLRRLYLFERFEINEGPPEHCSATSVVLLAKDHSEMLNSSETNKAVVSPKLVALKFMRNFDQFKKEVQIRQNGRLDKKYVIPVLMKFWDPCVTDLYDTFGGEDDKDREKNKSFREDSIAKGYEEYPFCVVMEAGSQSLKRLIDHERIAGNDWDIIRSITRSLAAGLQHLHGKSVVHGDLKRKYIKHV